MLTLAPGPRAADVVGQHCSGLCDNTDTCGFIRTFKGMFSDVGVYEVIIAAAVGRPRHTDVTVGFNLNHLNDPI